MQGEPEVGDAFGALLAAGLEHEGRGGVVFEVIERDDGHVRANDAARYFSPSWGVLDDWLYDRVKGRVLDIGCGAGRNSLLLAQRGIDVVGLDVSPGALEVCRRQGLSQLVEGSVGTPDLQGHFETFLLAGNNIGLLEGPEAAPVFLDRLAQLAAGPGSRILGTGVGREPGAAMVEEDFAYEAANLRRGRLRWQVTMRSRYRNLATDWFDYLFLTPEELGHLVTGSGWVIAELREERPGYAVRLDLQP